MRQCLPSCVSHPSSGEEDAEQIDELSPATLSSYKAKAAGSEAQHTDKSSSLSVPAKQRNVHAIKANQRRIGMKLATKKMGEETEVAEAAPAPVVEETKSTKKSTKKSAKKSAKKTTKKVSKKSKDTKQEGGENAEVESTERFFHCV